MKVQHTPGPWVIDPDGYVMTTGGHLLFFLPETKGMSEGERAEAAANACVAAAGPDLLAALRAWVLLYDGWSDAELAKRADPATMERIKRARLAIAKAEGRSDG